MQPHEHAEPLPHAHLLHPDSVVLGLPQARAKHYLNEQILRLAQMCAGNMLLCILLLVPGPFLTTKSNS